MSDQTTLPVAAPAAESAATSAAALLEVLRILRGVMNASSDLVFVKDRDSIFLACNQAYCDTVGREEGEQIGKSDFDFYPVEVAQSFRAHDLAVMKAGKPLRREEWVRLPDGRRRLLDTLKSPIHSYDGSVMGLVAISRDVTAERQRDREYRVLIETSHDGFWKVSADGRLLEVNHAYIRQSGYSRDELLTMRIGDLEVQESPAETARHLERLKATGADVFETKHRRKDGSVWQVEISTTFSSEVEGGVVFAFLRDIHQRKRDEKLTSMRLELGELSAKSGIDNVLRHALDQAELMTASNIGFFHFVDADQETLTLQAWSTNTLAHMCKAEAKGQHYAVSEAGVWAESMRQRRPVVVNDYASCANKKGMPEGHAHVSRVANVPIFDDAGQIVAVMGVGNKPTDYTDDDVASITAVANMAMEMVARRRDADRLAMTASVFEATQDGIVITDPNLSIVAVNRAFTQITGYTNAEVFGRDPRRLNADHYPEEFFARLRDQLRERGYWQGEVSLRNKSGQPFTAWMTLNVIRDAQRTVQNYLAVFSDLSEKKAADARADYLARFDGLTGLPNRSNFESMLSQTVSRARRRGTSVGLLLLGLDRFKRINESLGHPVGDEVLKAASERLQERLRHEDVLARVGGDEFAIMVEDVQRADSLAYLAQILIDGLGKAFLIGNGEVYIGASVGMSVFPLDAENSVTLLGNVDSALALAKSQGRGVYRFYTESLTATARERMQLYAALRQALQAGEFEVYYQPQIALEGSRVIGVEALVRWRRSDGSMVSPANFIPVAEETGLIEDLGAWVLRTACRTVKQWLDEGLAPLVLAVNVSPRQFRADKLPSLVTEVLAETGLPPELLELEITESAIMGQGEDATALLKMLKSRGVMLAIDDFGTGYSSLAYLKHFPVDKLKIDQSFVRDIPDDVSDMEIATTIIAMARHMRLEVLAEGVETQAQRDFLHTQGCDSIQGYLISRPVPAAECLEMLKRFGG